MYSHVEADKKKDGYHKTKMCRVDSVTDKDIAEAVRRARVSAQQIVADLHGYGRAALGTQMLG